MTRQGPPTSRLREGGGCVCEWGGGWGFVGGGWGGMTRLGNLLQWDCHRQRRHL
jgi:hypothetical protein